MPRRVTERVQSLVDRRKRSSRDAYIQRLMARQLVSAGRGTIRAKDVLFESA